MEAHKEIRADSDRRMEKILNAEQMKAYREFQANFKSKMDNNHQKKGEKSNKN